MKPLQWFSEPVYCRGVDGAKELFVFWRWQQLFTSDLPSHFLEPETGRQAAWNLGLARPLFSGDTQVPSIQHAADTYLGVNRVW
jgi:hypothetical protein